MNPTDEASFTPDHLSVCLSAASDNLVEAKSSPEHTLVPSLGSVS